MNISHPNTNSEVYRQFIRLVNEKVSQAEIWLITHKIDYVWNYWLGDHLYRIYIPDKDLLLDFEYYPVAHLEYSYIRVNYNDDMIVLLQTIFPENIIDTQDMTVWKLTQRYSNRFFREQGESPVYDKNVLRLGWVKDQTIYQCIVIKDNEIIRNVVRSGWAVPYGTYMLLRYLTEIYGFSQIIIKESLNNSFRHLTYQILNVPYTTIPNKKKIWWSAAGTKWHIKREDTDKYIPFYFCETRIYKYL